MEGINTQTAPTFVGSGYGQTYKEFAKKAARYTIDVTARNMALSYLGGRLFFGDAKNCALMTGVFYGAILPLSNALLKPFVKEENLSGSVGIVSMGVSIVAFKNFGFTDSAWTAAIDPWVTPGLTAKLFNLLDVLPDAVFSSAANLVDPQPSKEKAPQVEIVVETVSAEETPKAEVVVAENNVVPTEDANIASK